MRLQEYTLVVVIVVLLVVGTILKPDTFLTTDNVRAMLTQASVVGVLAIGMTFVIATSGIDLSVGSIVAAAGVAGGLLIDSGAWAFFARRPRLRAAAGHGERHRHRLRQGGPLRRDARHARHRPRPGAADERQEPHQPHRLRAGAVVRDRRDHRAAGVDLDLPGRDRRWAGWPSTACATAATSSSVGGNREAARIAGVPVRRTIFSVYCLSGLLAGLAAILLSGRLASASPVSGELLELDAIGATVIGGTSLAGGRATITGTFMGVVVFAMIFNLLTQLDLATEWQQIVKGVIILAAVLIQRPERI